VEMLQHQGLIVSAAQIFLPSAHAAMIGCVGSDRVPNVTIILLLISGSVGPTATLLYFGVFLMSCCLLAPLGSSLSPRRAEDVVISGTLSAWRVTLAFDDFSEITTRERTLPANRLRYARYTDLQRSRDHRDDHRREKKSFRRESRYIQVHRRNLDTCIVHHPWNLVATGSELPF
jgi:hypothetical protein